MKRAIAKNRVVYGRSELTARRVATLLRDHCVGDLRKHHAFKNIGPVNHVRDVSGDWDEPKGYYRFIIEAYAPVPQGFRGTDPRHARTLSERNRNIQPVFAFINVGPNLDISIKPDPEFPADMLDCLLSAGEKAFR